jgi:hypothetical protein
MNQIDCVEQYNIYKMYQENTGHQYKSLAVDKKGKFHLLRANSSLLEKIQFYCLHLIGRLRTDWKSIDEKKNFYELHVIDEESKKMTDLLEKEPERIEMKGTCKFINLTKESALSFNNNEICLKEKFLKKDHLLMDNPLPVVNHAYIIQENNNNFLFYCFNLHDPKSSYVKIINKEQKFTTKRNLTGTEFKALFKKVTAITMIFSFQSLYFAYNRFNSALK